LLANLPQTHSAPSEEIRRSWLAPAREQYWNLSGLVLNRLVTASSEVGEGPTKLAKKNGLMVEFGAGQLEKPVRLKLDSEPCKLAIWMNTLSAGHTLKEIASGFGGDEAKLEKMLDALVAKGVVARMTFTPPNLYKEAYWNAVWIPVPGWARSDDLNVSVLPRAVPSRNVAI
jgi:hypothetical protein